MLCHQIVHGESHPTSVAGRVGGRVRRITIQTEGLHALQLLVIRQGQGRSSVILHHAASVVVVRSEVTGRTGGHSLVDRRHLLIPADAQAAALSDVKVELHAQDTGSAGGGDQAGIAVGAELLGNDQLDDKVVLDLQAAGGVHIADWVGRGVDAGVEFHGNLTPGSVKVSFPTGFLFVVADDPGLLVKDTLVLASDLVSVLLAGSRDNLLMFFDAPHHLAQAPTGLRFLVLVHDTAQGHLDREAADGVNDGRKHNTTGQVGGREDTDGGLVVSGNERAAKIQGQLQVEILPRGAAGVGQQEVFNLAQSAITRSRQMTGEEVAEWEVMVTRLQVERLGEEVPASELLSAGGAVGAVGRDRLLGGILRDEADIKVVEDDLARRLGDGDTQPTREQCASRVAGGAVADQGRGFHQHLQLGRGLSKFFLAQAFLGAAGTSETAALVLAVVSVRVNQVIHVEGEAALGRASSI